MSQTIVALATPFGRSGIGVIRLSGTNALSIVRKLLLNDSFRSTPRKAVLKRIYDLETSEILDEVLITYFQAPHSFTGEDVIEIAAHGSPIILRQIIDLCLKLDARLAEPGEFSLRALANGQMNLSQAEAVRDLINSRTIASARQSIRQMRGELSNLLQPLKDELLNLIVLLESSLEFVEDDLPDYQIESICRRLDEISSQLKRLAETFRSGHLLREGIKVVLVGRPNVGKSSIFNSLIGQERAIVTALAGTTRDSLSEQITINDIPIILSDTAGIRGTSDAVEIIGVERSKKVLADADLVLGVFDGSEKLTAEDREIWSQVKDLNYLIVINKSDLEQQVDSEFFDNQDLYKISARDLNGFEFLKSAVVDKFLPEETNGNFLISDARHYDLLIRVGEELNFSVNRLADLSGEEIVLLGLHNALDLLGQITGETTTEDMLTRVFSTFCIGK